MSVFMNLARGNTVANNVGLTGDDFKFAPDYTYLELQLENPSTVETGQFVVLKPTVTILPRKCKIVVVPNQLLAVVGTVAYQPILEEGEGAKLGFSLKVESTTDLTKLPYLCRIYAIY